MPSMEDKQDLTEQQKILLSKLETLRAEMHRSVDARVDRSIQHILTGSVLEESPTLPLHTDPSVFKGKKPEAVLFLNGQSVRTPTWKAAVLAIMQDCNADPTMHTYLMELRGKVMGRQRTILADSPEKMHAPLEIDKELYMESYYDTASLLYVLKNRVLDEVGYDITFINRNVGKKATTYLQHCQYRGVDGVVIACVDFDDPQVLELVNSRLPIVTIDHVFNNRAAVVSDNVRGLEELVRYVYAKGHRRIAFIHGERTSVTENRLTGFYRACDELGLEIPEEYVREGVYHDPDRCAELTQELLKLEVPPTCILMPDDISSIGGGNAIRRMGFRLPGDVSEAGYDGIQLSSVMNPPLTTYRQDTQALGKTAAAKLIELIEKPRTALVDRILIPGRLVEGASVQAIEPQE